MTHAVLATLFVLTEVILQAGATAASGTNTFS